jgi:hypothetical protein
MLEAHPGFDSVGAFVEFYWDSYLTEQRRNVWIAFIEIYGQCLRGKEKYTGFFEEILFEWIVLTGSVLERHCGLRGSETTAWATLVVAVCRGLLLDHLAAGETKRVKAAVAVFQNMAESATGG